MTVSVKFGAQQDPDGSWLGFDARPAAVQTALAYTLRRLATDHVDIYRRARGSSSASGGAFTTRGTRLAKCFSGCSP